MPNRDLYDIHALYSEVNRRAAEVNATVRIDPEAQTAYTDGREVVVPAIKEPVTDEALTLLRHFVIHECGHLTRSGFFDMLRKEKIDMSSKLGVLLNIVEDEVQERISAAKYPGDQQALSEGRGILYGKSLASWREFCKDGDLNQLSDDSVKFGAAYYLAAMARDWDKGSVPQRDAMVQNGPPKTKALLKELLDEGWDKRIIEGGSPKKVLKLTRELFKRLWPNDDPEQQQQPQPQPGEGEGGEGDGDKKNAPVPKSGVIPWQQFLNSSHDENPNPENKHQPGVAIDWRGYGDHGDVVVPMQDHKTVTSRELDAHGTRGQRQIKPYVPSSAAALAERTRILLQSMTRSRWLYGTTSGKLNKRMLSRLAMPVVPGSDAYRRVFKQKRPGLELDCAVSILMDVSGSMNGAKMNVAGQCLMRLHHVLARALRLPLELACFSAAGRTARSKVVKPYSDRTTPVERVFERVNAAVSMSLGGNADGDAVLYALERLLKMRVDRRVLIVLSDGAPSASSDHTDPGAMLHAAIRAARKRGVEVYGIGILTDCVTEFYGSQCKVVKDVAELDEALVATLKEAVMGVRS